MGFLDRLKPDMSKVEAAKARAKADNAAAREKQAKRVEEFRERRAEIQADAAAEKERIRHRHEEAKKRRDRE